jgi:hypothetical protein
MTQDQIDRLVEFWLERELEEAEDARLLGGPYSDAYRDDVTMILLDQLEDAVGAELSYDFSKIEKEADELLKSAGLPVLDHDGAEFGRLCRRLLQGKQDFPTGRDGCVAGKEGKTTTSGGHSGPVLKRFQEGHCAGR